MRSGLARFWQRFKSASQAVGNVIARIILTIFYFVVMAPFAAVARWQLDSLRRTHTSSSAWTARPAATDDLTHAQRQF